MQNLLRALGDRRIALKDGKQSQKGFTLVELLVVVIIIGILAGIAIPVFLNQRESAWRAEAESDLKNASLAAETWSMSNNGSYEGMILKDLEDEGFTPSQPEMVEVTTVTSEGYILTAEHPDLGGATITFDSSLGGLQEWSDAEAPAGGDTDG